MRGTLAVVAGLAVTIATMAAGCTNARTDDSAERADRTTGPPPAGALRLVGYDSCEQALAGLRAAALGVVGAYGLGGDGAPPPDGVPAPAAPGAAEGRAADGQAGAGQADAGPEHSGTNVQEAGVDEPDLVKTDGRRIVTVLGGELRVVDAATRRVTGTLRLSTPDRPSYPQDANLLLAGDRALVLIRASAYYEDGPVARPGVAIDRPQPGGSPDAQVLLVDLSGPPRLLSRLTLPGQYVDARQVAGTARVVVRSAPRLRFVYPDARRSAAAAAAANRQAVRRSTAADWLPRYQEEHAGVRTEGQVPCERVAHPAKYSAASMLTVYSYQLAAPASGGLGPGDPVTIVADGDTVYGTARSLYVATDMHWQPGAKQVTEVHRFDTSGSGRPRYAASGDVPGDLLGRYAMSEYDDRLRIATTTSTGVSGSVRDGEAASESAVRVLEERAGVLVEVGRVGGLGKGERIYAVRFLGPVGYVVTFRQVDPLYTVDLRDPRRPRLAGELKITGYSAYLHPAGDGRLIGVGQEASADGQRMGAQVSLFDVRDPARPAKVAGHQVPQGYAATESDSHAFLYWPATGLVVVPVLAPDQAGGPYRGGALALVRQGSRFAELGTVRHPTPVGGYVQLLRAVLVGDTLWTLSDAGLQASNVRTLTTQGWLPFR